MNFTPTKEQELVRQMVREFAEKEVKPVAAEIDKTEEFPMENVTKSWLSGKDVGDRKSVV